MHKYFKKKNYIMNQHNTMHLKKISEKLTPKAEHSLKWWNSYMWEDEKK